MGWRLTLLLMAFVLAGCGDRQPSAAPPPTEVFSCAHLLIGPETVYCHEDVIGPGTLILSFRPDPKETSWEFGIQGLAALARECEFRGRFDQTRLSALQGRGEAEIVCTIEAGIDRQYHELRFENRTGTLNTSIQITVGFWR